MLHTTYAKAREMKRFTMSLDKARDMGPEFHAMLDAALDVFSTAQRTALESKPVRNDEHKSSMAASGPSDSRYSAFGSVSRASLAGTAAKRSSRDRTSKSVESAPAELVFVVFCKNVDRYMYATSPLEAFSMAKADADRMSKGEMTALLSKAKKTVLPIYGTVPKGFADIIKAIRTICVTRQARMPATLSTLLDEAFVRREGKMLFLDD